MFAQEYFYLGGGGWLQTSDFEILRDEFSVREAVVVSFQDSVLNVAGKAAFSDHDGVCAVLVGNSVDHVGNCALLCVVEELNLGGTTFTCFLCAVVKHLNDYKSY